jgi:hypothetical protein
MLLLLLLLALAPAAHDATPVAVSTTAEVAAAAGAGGASELLLTAHLLLAGARLEVAPGSEMTLRGDAAACGPPPAAWPQAAGLCVIDADALSAHFLVADGASLALHGVALVNGQTSAFGGSICVGVCGPDGNTDPFSSPNAVGGKLLLNSSLLARNQAGIQGTPAAVRAALRRGARRRCGAAACRLADSPRRPRCLRQAGCVNVDMLSRLTVVNTVFSECISYGNVRRCAQQCARA